MVTLSRWERDVVFPTWPQQPAVVAYLGYDPFTNPALGRPTGNETLDVASLSSEASVSIAKQLLELRMKLKKTRKQMAIDLGVEVKTLWGWEMQRHKPTPQLAKRVLKILHDDQRAQD